MTSSKASAGDRPLVCLDETSRQLIAETRVPIPMKARRPARFDYEYERNGTANLFMMFAPLEGWRHVKVTPTPRPSHPSASTAAFPTNKTLIDEIAAWEHLVPMSFRLWYKR